MENRRHKKEKRNRKTDRGKYSKAKGAWNKKM
jgi:hypothetical protein